MKNLLLLFCSILLLGSCEKETIDYEQNELTAVALKGKKNKISICHYNPHNGKYKTISVAEKQLVKHIEHGDKRAPCGYTYVPDDAFEQELIDLGYDDVLDDYVLTNDINQVTNLELNFNDLQGLVDLTGIEDFVSLENLEISGTIIGVPEIIPEVEISSLDVRDFENLTSLYLTGCDVQNDFFFIDSKIESLVLTNSYLNIVQLIGNSSLVLFDPDGSITSTLHIENNLLLQEIQWSLDSGVGEFLVKNNPSLEIIMGYNTGMRNVVLEGNPMLTHLLVEVAISSLIISSNPSLISINLSVELGLANIDLSNSINLESLKLGVHSINQIDVSTCPNLMIFDVRRSNIITCIQVSQAQLDNIPAGWQKDPEDTYALDCE